jgi:hypothetical protein
MGARLLLTMIAVVLIFSWIAGAFITPSDGQVADKHTATTYRTYGKGNRATSIPLETFLLVDTRGRTCKVSRGVWATTRIGDTIHGRWRGGK